MKKKEQEGFVSAEKTYNQYARYYDIMTASHVVDLPIYDQLTLIKPPPYLEVGCGTGRVLSHLLVQKPKDTQGLYLTGVDISEEMLSICRSKATSFIDEGDLNVVRHDFSVDALQGQRYNAAFITFFTLNYIPEHLQQSFLTHIGDSLNPDGIIAIDCFFPYIKWHPEVAGHWNNREPIIVDEGQIEFQEKAEMVTPTIEQREWIFTEPNGEINKITTNRMYLSPEKVKGLLESSGFTDIQRISDYNIPATQDFSEGNQGYSFMLIARKQASNVA